MFRSVHWALAAMALLAPSVARADVAPEPVGIGVVGGFALMLALPGGLLLGSLLYVMLARGATEAAAAKDPNLSIFQRPLWRRCFGGVTAVLFIGLSYYLWQLSESDLDARRQRQNDRFENDRAYEEPTVDPKSTTSLPN